MREHAPRLAYVLACISVRKDCRVQADTQERNTKMGKIRKKEQVA